MKRMDAGENIFRKNIFGKNSRRFASAACLTAIFALTSVGCLKDNEQGGYLESGLAILASSPTQLYTGLSGIPTVITQSASNASAISTSLFTNALTKAPPATGSNGFSSLGQGLDVGDNTLLQGITTVFNPVKDVIRGNEEAVTFIGGLIQLLRTVQPNGQILQGTDVWEGQPAKFQYQDDNVTHGVGGKKLEVWWDNAPAPYNSLKALELRFRDLNNDTSSDQNVNGEVWARVINGAGTALFTVHIDFDYTAATNVRAMSVVLQNTGVNANEKGHFYLRNENGITSLDGTFTVANHADGVSGASANRAYVFTAAGSDTSGRGVIKAAFPLVSNTNTNPYGNGQVEAFAEIWTDWFLSNATVFPLITSVVLPAVCQSLTQPSSANPTSPSGSTAAQLLTCMDAVRAIQPNQFDSIYFLPSIQNPAYFSLVDNVVNLQAVGAAPSGDSSYASVEARTLLTVRTTSDPIYAADLTANAVNTLDIVAGTSLPATAQWSTSDTAPF